jgi:predicted RNA-binding Zn-ribbon protein involved in translation (DUF1610 family)
MADINKAVIANTFNAFKCPTCGYTFIQASRCPECGQLVETVEEHQKRMQERIDMVRAMETVCRNINDEDVFMGWLMCGVADGDITSTTTDEEIMQEYCEDDASFAELMDCFLRCMRGAYKSGGLYCGRVVSNIGEENE